jgi:hypothetical protein
MYVSKLVGSEHAGFNEAVLLRMWVENEVLIKKQ